MAETDEERKRRKIDEQKEIFYQATKEWLNEKLAEFGWWSIKFIGAIVIFFLVRGMFALHASDLRDLLETTERVHQIAQ